MLKPKEFTIRKLVNNRTTIKTQDGSFKGSGGEVEVSFTFGDDVEVVDAIDYTKRKVKELQDNDEAEWLRKEPEVNNKPKEMIEQMKMLNQQNRENKKGVKNDSQS